MGLLQLRDHDRSRVPAGLHNGRPAGASPPSSEEFQQEGDDTADVADGLRAGLEAEDSDDSALLPVQSLGALASAALK